MEPGLRLAASLYKFWLFRNHVKEGRRHLDQLLALPAPESACSARAAAVGAAANLATFQADYEKSNRLARQALALYRELGDDMGAADQLSALGWGSIVPDPAGAIELFSESVEAYRRIGDPPEIGQALYGIALSEMQLGNIARAGTLLKEGTRVYERAGDENMTLIGVSLGGVGSRLAGDLEEARKAYVDVVLRAERTGSQMALTLALQALADLALVEGNPERAAVLEAARAQVAEDLGGTPSFDLMSIPDVGARARAELGDERFEAACARGRAAPLDEIVRMAISEGSPEKDRPRRAR